MEAKAATCIGCAEALAHQVRVDATRRTKLRDFLEQVVVAGEEKRQPRCELVDREPRRDGALHVLDRVCERERQLLHGGCARLADVVAADGNGIPVWHLRRAEAERLGHQRKRGYRRIDVRAAGDVFLENVVLDRAAERRAADAPLLGDDDVHRQQRAARGVDGHRRRDLVERNAVEERVHVFHGVDRDANTTHFAKCSRRIGIDTHLGGQIECDGEARLPGLEQHLVARVGLGGSAETGILPHGPQATAIHAGLHAAGVRKLSRLAEVRAPLVFGTIHRLDLEPGRRRLHIGRTSLRWHSTHAMTSTGMSISIAVITSPLLPR